MDRDHIDMILMVDEGEDPNSLIVELFDLFTGESSRKLQTLDAVCEVNDVLELRDMLHFVAGSAGNLGLARLCAFYRGIEQAIEEEELTRVSGCASLIRAEYELACEAFRQAFTLRD